ncbi:MAG: thermonuclease family protein [Alphaproteobacteria bacterium]|nr:thermonuclease family protein [Alphaproteobacteria bacterium]
MKWCFCVKIPILTSWADTDMVDATEIRLCTNMWATYHIVCSNDIHHLVRFTWADWCLSLFKFIATTFFALFYVQMVCAHEFVATIIKINDGDTLSAFVNNENTKIRLLDVDCYETKKNKRAKFQQQYYSLSYDEVLEKGKQSRKILKKLLKDHRYIRVEWEKRDSFGRILGKVYLDDIKSNGIIDINHYMLESGGCNKYLPKSVLKKSKNQ